MLEFLGRLMGGWMKWHRNRQWAKTREHDLQRLWPICKQQAKGDLPRARQAFFLYAFSEPAWVRVYEDRLYSVVMELK